MKRAFAVLLFVLCPFAAAATVRLGEDVVPVAQSIAIETDPRLDTFRGSVFVELDVKRPSRTFRFHAQDLSIVELRLSQGERPIDAVYSAGEGSVVTVRTGELLRPGRYALRVAFTNRYNRQAVGLYKMVTKDGEPYLFSQMEAIDARRAFPIWDEPRFKIPYQLTVTIPSQYDAVSNTPVESESASGETKTIRFARTKPLPSYLLALAVGKFDVAPIEGLGVPGRVFAPKGQGRLTAEAVKMTPPLLAALETYFGSKYPFEKLDLIAVPEYWAGAMENPGAITFRDTLLLIDSATATQGQRQALARITAHELAHMWFGDVVTMEWWNDLWLNESFADWMGDKITDQVFPQFESLESELGDVQRIMSGDARASAEPIRNNDATPEEAIRSVGLAYNKGKAVLSMFEQWIGPDRFRKGVLDHIKANEWSNADATEFFTSLSRHAPPGTAAALETFIAQPGIPLVTVERTGATTVRLTQRRFGADAKTLWTIPVALRYEGGTKSVLLDKVTKTVTLDAANPSWIYPHAHATGYYRWQMPEEELNALAKHAPEVLNPRERFALIGNLGALFRTGVLRGDAYLDLLGGFATDRDPSVAGALVNAIAGVRTSFVTEQNRPQFAAYLRRTMGPLLDRYGFASQPGESHAVAALRSDLLIWLAEHGDDERVWAWVREQQPKYLQDPRSVEPALAGVVLSLSAMRGDEALFEEYRKRFENASTPAERARYLNALRQFSDPKIRAKVREYALTTAVRPTELFTLVGDTDTAAEREDLYQWFTANYDAVIRKLPPMVTGTMAYIAGGCEPDRVVRVRKFFAEKKITGAERQLARVEEQVTECASFREREAAVVTRYLAEQGAR